MKFISINLNLRDMKKFTRLLQVMMILLISSLATFAQIEQTSRADGQKTSKETLDKIELEKVKQNNAKLKGQREEVDPGMSQQAIKGLPDSTWNPKSRAATSLGPAPSNRNTLDFDTIL